MARLVSLARLAARFPCRKSSRRAGTPNKAFAPGFVENPRISLEGDEFPFQKHR
jgi:hypothetical protein